MRQYEYEIVNNAKDKVEGYVWWDGKKIQSDDPSILKLLKRAVVGGVSFKDGIEFLQKLPYLYKSGYLVARKASNKR